MESIVKAKNLKKYFKIEQGLFRKKAGMVKAVDDVSLSIKKGEIFGLVGESGCGKTTCGKLLLNLITPDEGTVLIDNENILEKTSRKNKLLRKKAQIIFQDPFGSLNPRLKVEDIVLEAVRLFNTVKPARHQQKLKELLDAVGLSYSAAGKYPHQFSGGERQRIGIARALSTEPEFIVCDEPVSSLDVSIRAQILNLLKDLQQERNLSYLFISHDLNVVGFLSDIIAVMYKGKIVEQAESDVLYNNPLHPYTKRLLSANLKAEPQQRHKKIRVNFEEEQAQEPEKGCIFYPLCRDEKKDAQCKEVMPSLREIEPGHFVACCKIKK